jgi:PAS domain S-box-containing protein
VTLTAPSRRARTPDSLAVALVAWVRVFAAVALAASGSFPAHLSDRHKALFLLIGLVWVPWSVVVLFASESPNSPWAVVGGPVGDVLMLFATQALAPGLGEAVLTGYVVVVAFSAYTGGRRLAAWLGAGAIALSVLALAIAADEGHLSGGAIAAFAVAVVAIVLLLERTSSLHARTAARAARLQSESDAILARVADGVVVTDLSGNIRSCNPAADRIIGYPDDVRGLPCHEVLGLHIDQRTLLCTGGCALLQAVDARDHELGIEVWRSIDGRRQPLLANATPIVDDHGTVVEVVHSLRDITRLKQSEEAKTLFLATASHELKTPLTVIRGFVETMITREMDEDARKLSLQAVHRRAVELSSIVDRLLLSSRIEAGRVDLSLVDVDLPFVLRDRVLALATATGRIVDLRIGQDVQRVLGDEAALATVFEHLIDNAVKYSPDGGKIAVEGVAGERVVVTVSDEGIGMHPDQATHCFDKFWQAESTDVRRFGGTGIGLYIVRSLVEAMGGRISVKSEPGVGTSFLVELIPFVDHRPVEMKPAGVGEMTMIQEFMRQIGVPRGER